MQPKRPNTVYHTINFLTAKVSFLSPRDAKHLEFSRHAIGRDIPYIIFMKVYPSWPDYEF